MNKLPATLEVEVTQEDIDNGVRHSPELCPIARAVKRAVDVPYASASPYSVRLERWETHFFFFKRPACYLYRPDDGSIRKFVYAFDSGRPVEPIKLTLRMTPSRIE